LENSSNTAELQWFAVYTRSKAEKKVAERLSLAGFETFLPLQTVVKQWSDRKKKVQVPFINSYVFVQATQKDLVAVYPVTGVVAILKHLGKYAIVQKKEIENLRILSANSSAIRTRETNKRPAKGSEMTVLEGPFKGLFGTCVGSAGKHKIIIALETLGNFIEVTMGLSSVEEV
jgi:transcription antitermination factor NusG